MASIKAAARPQPKPEKPPERAEAGRAQLMMERVLTGWMVLIAAFHILTTMGNYSFQTSRSAVWTIDLWLTAGWAAALLLYAFITWLMYPKTLWRIGAFFKNLMTPEQLLLLALLVWYLVSCFVTMSWWGGEYDFIEYNRYYLLDAAITTLILFPMGLLLKDRPKVITGLLHGVTAVGTVFAAWALGCVYSGTEAELPGGAVAMVNGSLRLACNRNTTGAFAALFIMLCLYMITAQKKPLKIVYGVAALLWLHVLGLSNSRTALYSVMIGAAFAVFFLTLRSVKREGAALYAIAAAAAIVTCLLIYFSQPLSFAVYRAATAGGSSSAAARTTEITDFNGREALWQSFIPAWTTNSRTFWFGVTPVAVEPLVSSVGITRETGFSYMHNQYMQMAICFGLPGLLLYTVWSVLMCVRCVRSLKSAGGITLGAAILMLVAANMFESYLYAFFYFCGSVFFLLCGMKQTEPGIQLPKKKEKK